MSHGGVSKNATKKNHSFVPLYPKILYGVRRSNLPDANGQRVAQYVQVRTRKGRKQNSFLALTCTSTTRGQPPTRATKGRQCCYVEPKTTSIKPQQARNSYSVNHKSTKLCGSAAVF
jgi:hypothetical protein